MSHRIIAFIAVLFVFLKIGFAGAEPIKVVLVPEHGQVIFLNVDSGATVKDLKDVLFNVTQSLPGSQKFIKDGVELKDDVAIAKYNIADGDSINMIRVAIDGTVKKSGGMKVALIVIIAILAVIGIAMFFPKEKNPFAEYEEK